MLFPSRVLLRHQSLRDIQGSFLFFNIALATSTGSTFPRVCPNMQLHRSKTARILYHETLSAYVALASGFAIYSLAGKARRKMVEFYMMPLQKVFINLKRDINWVIAD
jgi:hypothetical protein